MHTPEFNNFSKFQFDNNNDILTIRTNYTYVNDTVILIDGGEEKGSGHSQAQGYFLYVLGEPLLDYEQVPYNNDVRMDTWKNGVSFQNTSQVREGADGQYLSSLGQYAYNKYYGSYYKEDTSTLNWMNYETQYPNYRRFPLEYGGDLENYVGTKDADFGGVYSWTPMSDHAIVKEYFVKYDDLLVKRTVVSGNNQSAVYHNFINVYNESDERINEISNVTFNRTRFDGKNVFLDINLIYSNHSYNITTAGLTNITICYDKTTCSTPGRYTGNLSYRRVYFEAVVNDSDSIIAHHWYYEGNQVNQTQIGLAGGDVGLNQSNNTILYDTNLDGNINYTFVNATGWALVYNPIDNETGAFNTTHINYNGTHIFSSNDTVSVFIKWTGEKIIVTGNTMQRDPYIDVSKPVNVTIDGSFMVNSTGFIVKKNGVESITTTEGSSTVSFIMITEQNSDYYDITATNIPPGAGAPASSSSGNISAIVNSVEGLNSIATQLAVIGIIVIMGVIVATIAGVLTGRLDPQVLIYVAWVTGIVLVSGLLIGIFIMVLNVMGG